MWLFYKEALQAFVGILLTLNSVCAERVLRFNEASCLNLEPVYEEEDLRHLGLGPIMDEKNDDNNKKNEDDDERKNNVVFETPKRLDTRNPPFSIDIDFTSYSPKRQYKVTLKSTDPFDAFILGVRQVNRGSNNDNNEKRNNSTDQFVGTFMNVPPYARIMKCGRNQNATVVDKGRPVKLEEISVSWEAPAKDQGPLRIVASVAFRDAYVSIGSRILTYKEFGMTVQGCGSEKSCFRSCVSQPMCQAVEAIYMVTMEPQVDQETVLFKLGGLMSKANMYVAIGFGQNSEAGLMEFVACQRNGNENFKLVRYFLEEMSGPALRHISQPKLLRSEEDDLSGFAWCEFTRPTQPREQYDLNLEKRWYQFYFWGDLDNRTMPLLPRMESLHRSSQKVRATSKSYNDIHYDPTAYQKYSGAPGTLSCGVIQIKLATLQTLFVYHFSKAH